MPISKRATDVILAIILVIPSAILIVFAAILIKVESEGPAIFRQVRVGKNKQHFSILKLRTMVIGTQQKASHEIQENQITKVGGWLRRTKIDELPQIWSVLFGHMSFVGPRPCLPSQLELIDARDKLGVYDAVPGITGPAQIAKIDMSAPQELALVDATYVNNWALATDLKLILATALGQGAGDALKRGQQ